ncbi:hypothetical protein HMPREF1207_03061 [Paenibacillus sp. HGH0039]|nr:hypothetical protein HMPREF1207_03061 [Paenibacillus sp. HGH0039]
MQVWLRKQFYPYEILFLIFVRNKMGLPVPEHFDNLLMNTPEAKMAVQDPEPYPNGPLYYVLSIPSIARTIPNIFPINTGNCSNNFYGGN